MSNRFTLATAPADRFKAPAASRTDGPARPTATDGVAGLPADRSACEEFDVTAAAGRSMAFEALDQLAMEHLPGAG